MTLYPEWIWNVPAYFLCFSCTQSTLYVRDAWPTLSHVPLSQFVAIILFYFHRFVGWTVVRISLAISYIYTRDYFVISFLNKRKNGNPNGAATVIECKYRFACACCECEYAGTPKVMRNAYSNIWHFCHSNGGQHVSRVFNEYICIV